MTPDREIAHNTPYSPSRRRARSLILRARELGLPGLAFLTRTFAFLLTARIALALIPVARIIAWKQRPTNSLAVSPSPKELQRIHHAILTVARYSPIRFVCFPQCLAAAALLRARGIDSRLHYGVARGPAQSAKLITHTWLEVHGQILIGGEVAGDYSTLAVY